MSKPNTHFSSCGSGLPESVQSALRSGLLERPEGAVLAVLPQEQSRPIGPADIVRLDCHPADWLVGLRVHVPVAGLALLTPGRVVDGGGPDGAGVLQPGSDVTAIAVVYPSGEGALHVVGASGLNGEGVTHRQVASNAEGLVPDAMRRALGAPCAAPQADPGWYWAFRWLQDLHTDGMAYSPGLLDLDDVICAHPVIEAREIDGLTWPALAEFCQDRHADHSWRTGWEGIRSALAGGAGVDLANDSEDSAVVLAARWHDEGSFSRWFLSRQPGLRDVYDTVAMTLTPSAAQLVHAVVSDVIERGSVEVG